MLPLALSLALLAPPSFPAPLAPRSAQEVAHVDLRLPRFVQRLEPVPVELGDGFGAAVALDGDTLVVGAPWRTTPTGETGAAWVFERDALGTWNPVAEILPTSSSRFGFSVAISGDVLAIGSTGSPAGGVEIHERIGGVWTLARTLDGMTSPMGPYWAFGRSLALEGGRLAIGAPQCGSNPFSICEPVDRIVVHERDEGGPGAWGQTAELSGAFPCRRFGRAVDLDGDRLAGGGYTTSCHQFGMVSIQERDPLTGAWGPGQEFHQPYSTNPSRYGFGWGVALSGDLLATWKKFEAFRVGVAIFREDPESGTWAPLREFPGPGENGGDTGLELQGGLLAFGTWEPTHGVVSLHLRNLGGPDAFGLAAQLSAPDPMIDDGFGYSIAIDGTTLAVTSSSDTAYTWMRPGAAYVYDLEPPQTQVHQAPTRR